MIKWWTAAETERHLAEMGSSGVGIDPTAVHAKLDGKSVEQIVRTTIAASATAKEIFDFIDKVPDKTLRVACTDNCEIGTVFDPDLVIFCDVGTKVWFAPTGAPPLTMPFSVLMFHELGHARQYLADKDLYERMVRMDETERVRGTVKVPKKPTKLSPADFMIKQVKWSLFSKLHYSAKLEWDNITRHEWPICEELGLPKRTSYLDFQRTEAEAISKRAKRNWDALKYGIRSGKAARDIGHLLPKPGAAITADTVDVLVKDAATSAEALAALVEIAHADEGGKTTVDAGAARALAAFSLDS